MTKPPTSDLNALGLLARDASILKLMFEVVASVVTGQTSGDDAKTKLINSLLEDKAKLEGELSHLKYERNKALNALHIAKTRHRACFGDDRYYYLFPNS